MSNVFLLRPYAPSASLRRLSAARFDEGLALLGRGELRAATDRFGDVVAINREARRSEQWELDVLGSRLAAEMILERARRNKWHTGKA